ncbi:hypothetical protein KNSL1_005062 [Colletotrichum chrysophilum]|nr:hypothetical protein KNSL1_005062 [Colletotrichum chrysophilum]
MSPLNSTMKVSAVLAAITLFAGVSMASPKGIDTSVDVDEGVAGGLESRGTCCTCPDGRKGCGGFCYSNCPQCIWKSC